MRIVKIGEIQAMEAGEVVPAVRGEVTYVGDQKSGTNARGEWSLQSIGLRDDTGECYATVWNRKPYDYREIKGRVLTLVSTKAKKGNKLVGLTVEESRGREGGMQLKVDVAAEITVGVIDRPQATPHGAPEDAQGSSAPAPQQPTQAPQQRTPPPPKPAFNKSPGAYFGAPLSDVELRKNLHRLGRLMVHCLRAATWVAEKAKEMGCPLTEGHFQGLCASLFIEANRKNLLGLVPDCDPQFNPKPSAQAAAKAAPAAESAQDGGADAGQSYDDGTMDDVPF